MKLKTKSPGRGRNYGRLRGVGEFALSMAYAGGWAARLWDAVRGPHVVTLSRTLSVRGWRGPTCRIVFLSDLHMGPTTAARQLDRAFAIAAEARPDVFLLGGDYVFLDAPRALLDDLSARVAAVPAANKFAVLGNHDLWTHDHAIVSALESGGARVLVNETVRLGEPWPGVALVGLDDPYAGECDAERAFACVDGATHRLVLCHHPDGLLALDGRPFDLYICGHTHGGHVAAPWGPLVLPEGTLCRRYTSGFYDVNGGTLFVSRGIGGIELPMRSFAPADVLVLDLTS